MADAIIVTVLIICGILALRSCLRKKCGKGGCGGCGGACGGCSRSDKHRDEE